MSEFDNKLRALLPKRRLKMRPFVCDGLPQCCAVLIVGHNPQNQVTTDWLKQWWKDEAGFNLKAFNQVYDFVRKDKGTRAKLDILPR